MCVRVYRVRVRNPFRQIAKPQASLGHMRDVSGPRFCFLARVRKIGPTLPMSAKHCEFICGGTELQCLLNFLPVWDRQGGNLGKHSNLAWLRPNFCLP